MLNANLIYNSSWKLYFVTNIFIKHSSIQTKHFSYITQEKVKTNIDKNIINFKHSINKNNFKNNSSEKQSSKFLNFQRSYFRKNNNINLSLNKTFKRNFCNKATNNDDNSAAHSQQIEKEFLKLDYYSMLNVKHNFHESELRKSYVQLAKHFHPDRFKGSPEIFKKLTEAYQTLKDDNKREEYNRKLKIKIHKNYKKAKNDAGFRNEANQEELRNASKYEEDFKKLNIDKLFHDFSNKKIKTSHEKIKVKNLQYIYLYLEEFT